jgi:hypothetical protein
MMSWKDFEQTKFLLTRNNLTETNFDNLASKINASVFDATHGLGIATAASSVILIYAGGFANQRMTTVMKYRTPTAQGTENFGAMLGILNIETTADATYWYFRVQAQVARITRVQDNVFTTLDSSAFPLPPDTLVTIVATRLVTDTDNVFTCTFNASGVTPVTLGALDPNGLTIKGGLGFRGTSQVMYCTTFTAEQL